MTTTDASTDPQAIQGKGDWALAAAMLAEGRGVMDTARAAGVCRTTLWRALNKSADFVRLIERRRGELAAESGGRLDALRALVAGQTEDKVREGDTRTVLWLARELGMVGRNAVLFGRTEPPAAAAEPDLGRIDRTVADKPASPADEPWASAEPDSEGLDEQARELRKAKQGIAYFRDKLEATRQELAALKAAVAAGTAAAPAVPAAALPPIPADPTQPTQAAAEPPERETIPVPIVPDSENIRLNHRLSLEPAGSAPVPAPFQTAPPRPFSLPRRVVKRVARSEARRMKYLSG